MRILRDLVRVAGPDAPAFLQGQLSQDVDALAAGGSAWALLLEPQGKIDAFLRVTRHSDEFLLDVDAGYGEAVVSRLERFKLRVKVDVELLGVRPCAIDADPDPATPLAALGPVVAVPTGVDVEPDWEPRWEAVRVRLGIPAMGRELTGETIPEEAGVVDVAVSFTKGCYTGQELVARIDSRGRNVPRRVRRVDADRDLRPGDELAVGGGHVGTVTSAAGREGLAVVARSVQPPTEVALAAGGVARVAALPPLR